MDSVANQAVSDDALLAEQPAVSARAGKLTAYLDLTKPRITMLVTATAAAGYCLGSASGFDYFRFFHTAIGIVLLSSGIGALNQYIERDLDRLMRRTEMRPLPAGRLQPRQALRFGLALSLIATVYLAVLVNPLSAALGVLTFAAYLFAYTPLKTRTTLSTIIGAFPGAMPPFIGWVAANGQITIEAWVLFAILFLWQFPHFLAIAWMYRDDYARAGIKMLPVVEREGRITGQQIIAYTVLLVPVSLMPTLVRLSGTIYFYGALALGLWFLYYSVRAARQRTTWQARKLLLASVLYLPVLFALMVLNR
ncbi:MAG: heme o synthase [Blastocatellia bacterium]